MSRQTENPQRSAASTLLWPFKVPYGIAARFKNCAYDRRWLQPQKLSCPVISVGNLSVGGSGKTPLVLLLADLLLQRGWNVDVLSRGYGRSNKNVAQVDAAGTPEEFGDEPLLMARHGLSVFVGANRYDPGQLAEEQVGTDSTNSRRLHILDDGFQHRKLARTVDIVLLQRADLQGQLLPVGRLREPISGLRRADICVLRAEDADLSKRVLQLMGRHDQPSDPARIWIVERRTTLPADAASIHNALAFCAIGDAAGFFDSLRHTGLTLQTTIAFRDHHVYNHGDVCRLKAAASRLGANCFVTTEKDSVRLPGELREGLEKDGRLVIAGLELRLQEEKRCIDGLESLLQERLQLHPRNVR
ncbi:MAG TPA: tetraacyldisaccharide 4'-kinase [Acidobacteriaceae bacterium]|nr:tetraacyldisaccharide 4'-kinase [Acidobacteriaceae bacterium]